MMQQYRSNSYLFGGNAPYVEELYEAYLDNPGSVPDNWRAYFDALQHVPAVDGTDSRDVAHAPVIESFAQRAKANAFGKQASSADLAVSRKQVHVQSLIAAYRTLGNRWAELDPLKRGDRPKIPELDPAFYGLTETDLDISFSACTMWKKMRLKCERPVSRCCSSICVTKAIVRISRIIVALKLIEFMRSTMPRAVCGTSSMRIGLISTSMMSLALHW